MKVLPGDHAGAIEEYMPAEGTFSSDEGVYSSNIGDLHLDAKSHSAKVSISTKVPKLQGVGIVTIGVVAEASEMVAIVDLVPLETGKTTFALNGISAVLHVSNIRSGYVKDLREEVKIGDMLRVKIISVDPTTTKLTIDGKDLGVIKAYCTRCRQPLRASGPKLVCDRCGNVEQRKTADDYDSGRLR